MVSLMLSSCFIYSFHNSYHRIDPSDLSSLATFTSSLSWGVSSSSASPISSDTFMLRALLFSKLCPIRALCSCNRLLIVACAIPVIWDSLLGDILLLQDSSSLLPKFIVSLLVLQYFNTILLELLQNVKLFKEKQR